MEATVDIDQPIAKILERGKEAATRLHWWQRAQYSSLLEPVEEEVDRFLLAATKDLNKPEIQELIRTVKARREKLPLSTGITNQIVGICQQILAFGAAGIALAVGFVEKARAFPVGVQKTLAIAGIWYLELMVLSLLVLMWYMLQARFRYPFLYLKKIGNAWPWFYYPSISPSVSRSPVQRPHQRVNASIQYAVDFLRFTKRCLEEKPHEQLRAELQQYFLLMAYMAYVHQFSLRLTNIFFYGLVGSATTVVVLGLCSILGVL